MYRCCFRFRDKCANDCDRNLFINFLKIKIIKKFRIQRIWYDDGVVSLDNIMIYMEKLNYFDERHLDIVLYFKKGWRK